MTRVLHSRPRSLEKRAGSVTHVLGFHILELEAPPGFEPGMEVLQVRAGPIFPSKFDDFLNDLYWWHSLSSPGAP
jgi:hypothetical protein